MAVLKAQCGVLVRTLVLVNLYLYTKATRCDGCLFVTSEFIELIFFGSLLSVGEWILAEKSGAGIRNFAPFFETNMKQKSSIFFLNELDNFI